MKSVKLVGATSYTYGSSIHKKETPLIVSDKDAKYLSTVKTTGGTAMFEVSDVAQQDGDTEVVEVPRDGDTTGDEEPKGGVETGDEGPKDTKEDTTKAAAKPAPKKNTQTASKSGKGKTTTATKAAAAEKTKVTID